MKKLLFGLVIAGMLVSACSKDKKSTNPVNTDPDTTFLSTNIKEEPTYFSLEDMETQYSFDLLFVNETRDLSVYVNGGIKGSAGVTGKNLGAVDFNAEADISEGFHTVTEDTAVIGGSWYNYDFTTHTVTSKGYVYLIKGIDYQVYKIRIDSYGTDQFTISVAQVDESGKPMETKTATISASAGSPGYFSLSQNAVVEAPQWDIAFVTIPLFVPEMGASILNPGARINSTYGVEVATVEGTTFEDVDSVPSGLSYEQDAGETLALGDKILNYNPQTHKLTSPDVVYIVKTRSGEYAKVAVTSYYHPETGESGYINFKAELLK